MEEEAEEKTQVLGWNTKTTPAPFQEIAGEADRWILMTSKLTVFATHYNKEAMSQNWKISYKFPRPTNPSLQ